MKLNLGCGSNVLEGYVNVDLIGGEGIVEEDLVEFLLHTKPESVDEILLQDVLEHLPHGWVEDEDQDLVHTDVNPTAIEVLNLVLSRLVSRGIVHVRVPDFGWLIDRWYEWRHNKPERDTNLDFKRLTWMTFGEVKDMLPDTHKSAWTAEQMKYILTVIGFSNVQVASVPPNLEIQARKV